ncbi:hypothetical protein SKAU_G00134070 [Synaphobranchus kaupii]|uniref:Uncharacterized protein n=1 Tax=Synaphobranchus kaupii TaxID=118154 RepID=A0A9Q1FRI3_SYNKA|nr:hypothetical protein SKAU_G00134070 [Synaphobranchus kaupii]
MLVRNDSIRLCGFVGQPIFRRMLNKPSLLTKSNALVRSMKATSMKATPGVDGGRRSCLPLIFLHGIRIGIDSFSQLL